MKTPETNENSEYYDEKLARTLGQLLSDWFFKKGKLDPKQQEIIDRANNNYRRDKNAY